MMSHRDPLFGVVLSFLSSLLLLARQNNISVILIKNSTQLSLQNQFFMGQGYIKTTLWKRSRPGR